MLQTYRKNGSQSDRSYLPSLNNDLLISQSDPPLSKYFERSEFKIQWTLWVFLMLRTGSQVKHQEMTQLWNLWFHDNPNRESWGNGNNDRCLKGPFIIARRGIKTERKKSAAFSETHSYSGREWVEKERVKRVPTFDFLCFHGKTVEITSSIDTSIVKIYSG